MPSFVIVTPSGKPGPVIDATLCDPSASGGPDRKTDVPVSIRIASDNMLYIDDEPAPRAVLSSTGGNGITTMLVSGSTKSLRNRQRRAALTKVASLLNELSATIRPLVADSEYPDFATSSLQQLFDWMHLERERLT